MKIRRAILVLFFVFTNLAYSFENKPVEAHVNTLKTKIDEFGYHGFETEVGNSLDDIITKFGKPQKVDTTYLFNIRPEQFDLEYDIEYQDLQIGFYWNTLKKTGGTFYIKVLSEDFKIKWGLNVGVSKNKVIQKLGMPVKAEKNLFLYIFSHSQKHKVMFNFRDDKVSSIEWVYYWD